MMKLLGKITELVDKDVAAHGKPLSIAGAAIPFIPFMLFVDGAPLDSYPILASLAFSVSIAWLGFVMWRKLRQTRSELEEYGYEFGSWRFWKLMIGTILIIAVAATALMWLQGEIG